MADTVSGDFAFWSNLAALASMPNPSKNSRCVIGPCQYTRSIQIRHHQNSEIHDGDENRYDEMR